MKITYYNSNVEKVLPSRVGIEDYVNYKEMMSFYGKFSLINKIDILLPSSNMPSLYIGNTGVTNIDVIIKEISQSNYLQQSIKDSIFAGGKGLTLYKTICSSFGEAFERFIGLLEFYQTKDEMIFSTCQKLVKQGNKIVGPKDLVLTSSAQRGQKDNLFDEYTENSLLDFEHFYELKTRDEILIPACVTSLYYNPSSSKAERIGYSTSGGLTSHYLKSNGYIHGILEILERHEINLSWYSWNKPKEIIISNSSELTNKTLKKFYNSIKSYNIRFFIHNVDQFDAYVITAISLTTNKTYSFSAGGGIALNIEDAMLKALEEYFQSINNTFRILHAKNWVTSKMSNYVLEVKDGDDPKKFKTFYQATSYYGLESNRDKLDWFFNTNEIAKISDFVSTISDNDFLNKYSEYIYFRNYAISNSFRNIYISKVFATEFTTAFIAGRPLFGHCKFAEYLDRDHSELNGDILPFP